MPQNLFTQNIIALIWDFDKTLAPGYMQEPLLRRFGVDSKKFWTEVNNLPDFYKKKQGLDLVPKDTLYLNHILTYVSRGIFKGLNNKLLRELGSEIEFYPGLPQFLEIIKERIKNNSNYKKHEIKVEHYIASTGLRQMILGSRITPYVNGVWACEFIEEVAPPGYLENTPSSPPKEPSVIVDIGYSIDNTTKTRAVFEINKGTNVMPQIDVNALIRTDDRRVPFENMIYIADGPSDIPVFSLIKQNRGRAFAVYKAGSEQEFNQVNELQKQGRVQSFGEANYTEGSKTFMWLVAAAEEIANRIIRDKERALDDKIGAPPRHIVE